MTSYANRIENYDTSASNEISKVWDQILDRPEGLTMRFKRSQDRCRMTYQLNLHRKAYRVQHGSTELAELMRIPEMDAYSIKVLDDLTLLISPGSITPEYEIVDNPTPTSEMLSD